MPINSSNVSKEIMFIPTAEYKNTGYKHMDDS